MKRNRSFFSTNAYWNKLVHKFYRLNAKIKNLISSRTSSKTQVNILLDRLSNLYRKLSQLQLKVGVKIAGTALALMLASATVNAQDFTKIGNLRANETDIDVGYYASPVFADIDDDGDLDLYVANFDGTIKVFTNDGSGVYSADGNLQANGIDINAGYQSSIVFADIDGDGDLDLYVGSYYGNIKVFTNDGGIFSADGNLKANGTDIDVGKYSSPMFVDIDGDDDLDLYIGEGSGIIKIYRNNNGAFSADGNIQVNGTDIDVGSYSSPVFADIDGDGDFDLYVGNYYGNIKVFINGGNGVFSAGTNLQANGADIDVGYYASPTFADIDGDGNLDLYVGNEDGNIKVYTNGGSGVFSADTNFQANEIEIDVGYYASPVFEDIDDDGNLDLYVGERYGTIKMYRNNSGVFIDDGNLKANGIDINVVERAKPIFADIDGDGDLDLYVGERYGMIKIYRNNSGVFTADGNLQANGTDIDVGNYSSPEFTDIDGDGDLDLYVGNYNGNIKVFTNSGSGVFSASGNLQADSADIDVGYNSIPVFEDINGDGNLDLYIGNYGGNIKVFTNDGNGVFTTDGNLQANGTDIDVGMWASPTFADIDGDGDLDLYVGNNDGNIVYYKNLGLNVKVNELPEFEISAFPNPTSGIVNFSFNEQSENYNIQVVDINGKTVESFNNINQTNFKIDMSNHDKGLYIIKVYNDKAIKTAKIIVE